MAVNQRQSLACMQGHCHATERQRTGPQTTGSQLFPRPRFLQARLGTTPFSTPSGHVYRRTVRIEDVMHFGRTGSTADPWRCAALSYQLHFHLLLTEKTNNMTPMLHCKVNTSCKDTNHATSCIGELPRELPRGSLERLRLVDQPNEGHPPAKFT